MFCTFYLQAEIVYLRISNFVGSFGAFWCQLFIPVWIVDRIPIGFGMVHYFLPVVNRNFKYRVLNIRTTHFYGTFSESEGSVNSPFTIQTTVNQSERAVLRAYYLVLSCPFNNVWVVPLCIARVSNYLQVDMLHGMRIRFL